MMVPSGSSGIGSKPCALIVPSGSSGIGSNPWLYSVSPEPLIATPARGASQGRLIPPVLKGGIDCLQVVEIPSIRPGNDREREARGECYKGIASRQKGITRPCRRRCFG